MPRFNPPAPAIMTNCVRLTVRGQFQGNAVFNTIDYVSRLPIVLSTTVITSVINSWIGSNALTYLACMATDYSMTSVLGSDLFASVVPTQFVNNSAPGTVAGESLPSFNSAVISKNSDLKGQHGRGRMYMGPVPEAFVDAAVAPNELTGAAIAAYQLYRNAQLVALNVAATFWDWVITTRPIPPDHFVTKAAKVTSAPIDVLLGTVRRRIQGRGI